MQKAGAYTEFTEATNAKMTIIAQASTTYCLLSELIFTYVYTAYESQC